MRSQKKPPAQKLGRWDTENHSLLGAEAKLELATGRQLQDSGLIAGNWASLDGEVPALGRSLNFMSFTYRSPLRFSL